MSEQISVKVTKDVYEQIEYDCEMFNIKSRAMYIMMMAHNYSAQYTFEQNQMKELLVNELKKVLDDSYYGYTFKNSNKNDKKHKCEEIVDILQGKMKAEKKLKSGDKPIRVTDDGSIDFSDIKNMSLNFFQLPSYKREEILFIDLEKGNNLSTLTKNHTTISFSLSNLRKHTVYPYKLVPGKNKIYSYLLCGEKDADGHMYAVCYHIYKIKAESIQLSKEQYILTEETKQNLDKMIKNGPEHAINSNDKSIIALTEVGENMFKSIYYDRPNYIDRHKEDQSYIYTFDCDENHLFLYFKKFGCDVTVIENDSLKNKLKEFYVHAANMYVEEV